MPPPSVGLSFASAERASPRSKSWKIEAPPPSRSEKRRHPAVSFRMLAAGSRRGRGLTLVELMVALGILGALSAVMIPGYMNGMPSRKLKAAAREVFAHYRHARSEAVARYRAHRVSFDLDNACFHLEQGDQPLASACVLWEEVKGPRSLPAGIALVSVNGITTGVARQAFNVNGTAQAGNVIMSNSRGERYRVWVTNSGVVRMEKM